MSNKREAEATAKGRTEEATPESEAAGSRVIKHPRASRAQEDVGAPTGRAARGLTSELQQLQERLLQAEKLADIGRFVAGIVHELNNPLTSIIASASHVSRIVAQRPLDDLTQGELLGLRRIDEAAKRMLEFSQDLVSYARPASSAPSPVSLPEVLDRALLFCEHVFDQREIQVRRELSEPLPTIVGHKNQLTQLFINLFTNAAHASPKSSGRVEVKARTYEVSPKAVLIEVADNGDGIGKAHLDKVFEPFFTTKPDGQGSGLGLSIAQEIVKRHGGKLQVKSSVGRGTVFSVLLPSA